MVNQINKYCKKINIKYENFPISKKFIIPNIPKFSKIIQNNAYNNLKDYNNLKTEKIKNNIYNTYCEDFSQNNPMKNNSKENYNNDKIEYGNVENTYNYYVQSASDEQKINSLIKNKFAIPRNSTNIQINPYIQNPKNETVKNTNISYNNENFIEENLIDNEKNNFFSKSEFMNKTNNNLQNKINFQNNFNNLNPNNFNIPENEKNVYKNVIIKENKYQEGQQMNNDFNNSSEFWNFNNQNNN